MKRIIILFSLMACISPMIAQVEPPPRTSSSNREPFIDRLTFGGHLGLQFGNQTYVEVAPLVGYRITERLIAGIGLKYIYYKFDDRYLVYSDHLYGGGPFARYLIFEELFVHVEHEVLNMRVYDYLTRTFQRKNISSVFVGGGYRQMIGDNSAIELMLLYNINESINSPYINPIFRVGFGFGL
jgi:hypothetical protein